jgi:hypothetical protein
MLTAYSNLGALLTEHEQLDAALSAYEDAAEFEAWSNKFTIGKLEDTLSRYVEVATHIPLPHRNRAIGICQMILLKAPDLISTSQMLVIAKAVNDARCRLSSSAQQH